MNNYWKKHWDEHVEKAGENPFEQVARTLNKEPMSKKMFQNFTRNVIKKLELNEEHTVLDLCCGNGLLSIEVAKMCKHVVGVDFSQKLINHTDLVKEKNFTGIISDVLDVEFQSESFDRILIAAALQLFTLRQTIYLFKNVNNWLKPGGIFLVTDITDNDKIWSFFDSKEREQAYFNNTFADTPIIGTWFDRIWLEKLGKYSGFNECQVLDQPQNYWYSHYRFDFQCRKST